jgi:hypothetical protein
MRIQFIWLGLVAILLSPSVSAQWVRTDATVSGSIYALAAMDTTLFAGTGEGEVYLTTDGGNHWRMVISGLSSIHSLTVIGTELFASAGAGAFRSADKGTSWTKIDSGLTATFISFAVAGNVLIGAVAGVVIPHSGGTTGSGIFRSTNRGASWTLAGLADTVVLSLAASVSNVYAGVDYSGVFRSTNEGASWQRVSSGLSWNSSVYCLALNATNLFAGVSSQGVYRSTDNGASWFGPIFSSYYVHECLCAGESSLFVVADGLYASNDNGATWRGYWDGLPNRVVLSQAILGDYFYIGMQEGVFKRPLSDIVPTKEPVDHLPDAFSLLQNYPNPFNPSTTIRYGLPHNAAVQLSIINTLGQQVALLQNGEQDAGYHEVRFDGKGVSSGVYYYRIQAGEFVQTKKLLLLR